MIPVIFLPTFAHGYITPYGAYSGNGIRGIKNLLC